VHQSINGDEINNSNNNNEISNDAGITYYKLMLKIDINTSLLQNVKIK